MHRKGFFFECQEGSGLVKRLSLYHHIKTVTTYSGKKKKEKKKKKILFPERLEHKTAVV